MGRLVLRRRSGESLTIGDNINIEVLPAHGESHEVCVVRFKIGEDVKVDVSKEGRHMRFTIEAPSRGKDGQATTFPKKDAPLALPPAGYL